MFFDSRILKHLWIAILPLFFMRGFRNGSWQNNYAPWSVISQRLRGGLRGLDFFGSLSLSSLSGDEASTGVDSVFVPFVGDEFPEGLHYFCRRELDASCHESSRGLQTTEVAEIFFSPC